MRLLDFDLPDKGLVLLAGRPGMGKTFTLLKMADELKGRPDLPYALLLLDRNNLHRRYEFLDGTLRQYTSQACRYLHEVDDPRFVPCDDAEFYSRDGFSRFLKDVALWLCPKVILLDSLRFSRRIRIDTVIRLLKRFADRNGILIIAECPVRWEVEEREDRHPHEGDQKCRAESLSSVDRTIFLYRDAYYDFTVCESGAPEMLELYSDGGERLLLLFTLAYLSPDESFQTLRNY